MEYGGPYSTATLSEGMKFTQVVSSCKQYVDSHQGYIGVCCMIPYKFKGTAMPIYNIWH